MSRDIIRFWQYKQKQAGDFNTSACFVKKERYSRNAIFSKQLSVSKPPALNSFWLISIEYIHLQDFELTVQAALGIFNQTANSLITLTARKRISQVNAVYHCSNSDQMAPPFGNPPPLKRWTKLFALLSFVLFFQIVLLSDITHSGKHLVCAYSAFSSISSSFGG